MIPLENFDIRYSVLEDLPYLQDWFKEETSCDAYPFNSHEKDEALKNWIGFSKYKASLTGVLDHTPCAMGTLFLMPYKKVAHHCSFYLIVDPTHRRKGIGTSIVRNLLHLAKTRFRLENVHVEIYEPSALLSILLKLDFHLFVRQENFMKMDGCKRARLLLEHVFK